MRKGRRNISIAAVAACAAILFILLALLALCPEASSRYIDEDHFTGEIVSDTTENKNHGGHSDWTAITQSSFDTSTGVCTISSAGSYYLKEDVVGQIAVTAGDSKADSAYTAENRAEVNICLNGHVLDGNGAETALLIGDATEYDTTDSTGKVADVWGNPTYVTVNLYDCGGSADEYGNYDNVHYYRYGESETLADGTEVHKGYHFSDFTITDENGNEVKVDVNKESFDGYIRGGLITGGYATANYYGGGVTVGYDTEFNMYGGTVAGNDVSTDVGVDDSDDSYGDRAFDGTYTAGGVVVWNASFCLYGGTIEGNFNPKTDRTSAGGVLLCPDFYIASTSDGEGKACFNMYGGEIRNNYTCGSGGGVNVAGYTSGSSRYHKTWFYMYGGVIEGNYAYANGGASTTEGGGGVLIFGSANVNAGAYFYMYGGTIRDNVCSGAGAGVYVHSVCQCYIAGKITGNRGIDSRDRPAGFFCSSINYTGVDGSSEENGRSVITIAGSAYIYGNYANGKKSNFGEFIEGEKYLYYAYITLGTLTEGARIGVTCQTDDPIYNKTNTQITNASSDSSDYLKYFWSDDSAYEVAVNGSGSSYIELVKKQ